ncbi:MAG: C25 family cysteine peptidase, partial [Anaerolineales bacterium]
ILDKRSAPMVWLSILSILVVLSSCNFPSGQDQSPTGESRPALASDTPSPSATITATLEPTATPTTVAPVDGYVILTDLDPEDAYYAAVDKLAAYRQAEVLTFGGDITTLLPELQSLNPEFMAIVTRPERIEETFTFQVFMLAKEIQPGFETDAAYGFITGITAEDAVAYVDNLALYERGLLNQNENFLVLWRTQAGSVSGGAEGMANDTTQAALDLMSGLGFASQRVDMDSITKSETMEAASQAGFVFVFAHGAPNMIECGLNCQGDAIMAADIPAFEQARFVVSSACYGGVVHTWFNQSMSGVASYSERVQQADPAESIALNFLRNGAIGYIGHLCMWGSNNWPLTLMETLSQNPDLSYGQMLQAYYNRATQPLPITASPAADLIGMDNNQFYYAAMVLYGDPAVRIQLPDISE